MARPGDDHAGQWSTLTHARIRALQGDWDGARKILEAVLSRQPDDERALGLLGDLEAGIAVERREQDEEVVPPRRPADARALAGRFRRGLGRPARASARQRIARLERWLKAMGRPGGDARTGGA